ncbi:MAG: DUF3105 domain-containing protein [Nocardioides sp.]
MAKPTKSERTERQARVEKMLNQQRSAERSRGMMIVGACMLVGLLIIGAAAYKPIMERLDARQHRDTALEDLGAPASACQKITTKEATGNQEHVEPGTPLDLKDAPPAFGTHYNVWEPMDKKLYTKGDRPEVGRLIHNLEHGYTLVWYDKTAAGDPEMMSVIRGMADKFGGTTNLRHKFIAVPWLKSDGKAFPKGQHIAYTHWSVGGTGSDATGKQVGVWQYCSSPSGAALQDFMIKYPYMDSPEPTVV